MSEQHIAVPLLEGVHSSADALTLRHLTTIGGFECRMLLPGPYPGWAGGAGKRLTPPYNEFHSEDPSWPEITWGLVNDDRSATIEAVGLIPIGTTIPPGNELVAFDRAVGRWKELLRNWLSVIAEGPTAYLEPAQGETRWGSAGHDHDLLYANYLAGDSYEPQRVSRWQWEHVLGHVRSADQPPLARALMTTAARAAAAANWRVAIIDAATATEAALTAGLVAQLSATLSPSDVERKLNQHRMLGKRVALAGTLNMPLPAGMQEDLVDPRNAAMHQGTGVTSDQVKLAMTAAWAVVDRYEPLPPCCQEPFDHSWEPVPDE